MNKNLTFQKKAESKEFLEARIYSNKKTTKNFDEWSVNIMPSIPLKANILDLGCGTGKQIKLFSPFLSKSSKIFALDISGESLQKLKEDYSSLAKLFFIQTDFNKFPKYIPKSVSFDLIYAFYALYYAKDNAELIKFIYKYLKKDGKFWVVGPYKGTNGELFNILQNFYKIDKKILASSESFYKNILNLASKQKFKNVKINILENKTIFSTALELLNYLKHTTFYYNKFEKDILKKITKYFQTNDNFYVSKNIISLLFEK